MLFRKFENSSERSVDTQGEQGKGKAFLQNLVMFFVASFLPKATTFFMLPLYTFCLTTEEYGVVDLLNSTVQLALPFCTLQIQDAMLRFALDKDNKPSDVITIGTHIACIGTLGLALLCGVAKIWIAPDISAGYYLYLVTMVFLHAINSVASYFCKGIEKISIVTIANVTSTFVTVLCNLLFLLVFKWTIEGYLLASCIGLSCSIALLIVGARLPQYICWRPTNRDLYKKIILFSIPMIFSAVSWWVNTSLDKYLLNVSWGNAAVGVYAVSHKIPSIFSMIGNVVASAFSISAIKHFDPEDKDAFLGKSHSRITTAFVFCTSVLMFLNKPLARMLFAKDFYIAWKTVPVLLLAAFASMMSLVCEKYYLAVNKTNKISATAISGAMINLIIALGLVPKFGVMGAAIASACGFGFCWGVRYWGIARFINLRNNGLKEIVMLSLLIVQAVAACSEDSKYIVQILVLTALILLNGRDLVEMISFGVTIVKQIRHRSNE